MVKTRVDQTGELVAELFGCDKLHMTAIYQPLSRPGGNLNDRTLQLPRCRAGRQKTGLEAIECILRRIVARHDNRDHPALDHAKAVADLPIAEIEFPRADAKGIQHVEFV